MNDLEKYQNQQVVERLTYFNEPENVESDSAANLIVPIMRHWRIVLLTFLLICGIGIPSIWFSIKPVYVVTGAIRVAPILRNILSGKVDRGEISNYQSFMNTQAIMVTSSRVVQRVADDLVDKNLDFFIVDEMTMLTKLKQILKGRALSSEPVNKLKYAIANGTITATTSRGTELIDVTMENGNFREAKQIINAFIRAYMAVEVSTSVQDENRKLTVLENVLKTKAEDMERQRQAILQMGREYGDTALVGRHDMKLKRVATLLGELTTLEAARVHLEAQVQLLEKDKEKIDTEEMLQMKNEYVNSDPMATILVQNIVQLEQALIIARQKLTSKNPELKRKIELIGTLKHNLSNRKRELEEKFNTLLTKTKIISKKQKLLAAKEKLEQLIVREQRFRELLTKEDSETIDLGRKKLTIQDLQDQLALNKETYDMIRRRIQELEMERKQPARISVAYNADIIETKDKRRKYTAAILFGSLACGMVLAILKGKTDKSLYTPQDITKCVNIKIIGTTYSRDETKKFLLPHNISEDYQNICTNLGLFDGRGIPGKLVITSPGPKEGKTTLAVNIAKSIADTGKKVLLIDGDFRKPDIQKMLDVNKDEKDLETAVSSTSTAGLDLFVTKIRKPSDISLFISEFNTNKDFSKIKEKYDHVIVDTPPVLAAPDALLWAKMADAVILTTFAGHTEGPDLKITLQRFAQVNIEVLGIVLNNVPLSHSYNPYGYGYGYKSSDDKNEG